MFTTCHPALSTEARVALTLRMLGGLTTPAIARAFLVPEATVAQRIVRAKKALASERIPFEIPEDIEPRVASVLEVVYLIFNEGYSATAGDDWMRPALCEDALRLGRILATLAPAQSEVHGLVALMEIQASRTPARTNARRRAGAAARPGPAALGPAADRAWADRARSARSNSGSGRTGCRPRSPPATPGRQHAEDTDWVRIAALYATLARVSPSPVVELNRAVAIGMAFGPAAALSHVEALSDEPALRGYHLLPSVRADLLAKLGRDAEARTELERAATLTSNARERDLLLARARSIDPR